MNFYTSDLHFFHKNICNLTDRNTVTNPENHTQWLIDLWNSQVSEYDTVYVLGDFSFGNLEKTKEVIQKLKGSIVLILGNHDKESDIKLLHDSELIDFYFNYLEIKIEGVKACMSHYPMVSWNKKHYGSYMLHGHTHGHYTPEIGKILDVGLDSYYNIYRTYGFFSEKQIVDYMNGRKDQDTDHHNRETK